MDHPGSYCSEEVSASSIGIGGGQVTCPDRYGPASETGTTCVLKGTILVAKRMYTRGAHQFRLSSRLKVHTTAKRMYTCGCEGEPLLEVFGIRFPGGEAPTGTVSVFDGKRGQIIYSGGSVHKPSSSQTQRPGGRLSLTGPYCAISADGCVAIVLDLHHYDRNDTESSSTNTSYVDEILLDVYHEATKYDEPITSVVSSTRGDGWVEVTYALLSDAAEAVIEVRLLRCGQASGAVIGGTVVARTNLGEVVLFDDDCARVGTEGVVPLARSVVAVPLTSHLTIELNLVDGDDDEVAKESVVFEPKVRREEVCRRSPAGAGAVEVKITWLD